MDSAIKSLMGKLSLFFNRKDKKRRFHILHYEMWNYIAKQLQSDSDYMLSNACYIANLKRIFMEINHYEYIFQNCFLCDLYHGTQEEGCRGCPLYNLYGGTCISDNSPFRTVCNSKNERAVRVKAAKMVRDCVLRKGGK